MPLLTTESVAGLITIVSFLSLFLFGHLTLKLYDTWRGHRTDIIVKALALLFASIFIDRLWLLFSYGFVAIPGAFTHDSQLPLTISRLTVVLFVLLAQIYFYVKSRPNE